MTRSTFIALLLIALGFLTQPSEDRFGYLMGVAWLAIVYGCHQLWEANRGAA